MNEKLIEKIRQCPNLPTLPAIAIQVVDLAQTPTADMAEIARVISKDPALSGKILRTVNSSFYGRSQAVSTISHASVILGLHSLKSLVLGFSLVTNLVKNKSKGFKHINYWRRSIFAATAARAISVKVHLVQQEEAFVIALLGDIGMLVLDQVLGDSYGELCTKAKTHLGLPALERQALGMDHAQVGGILAEQWKLPPVLCIPIAHHHAPQEVDDAALEQLTDVVWIASRCADIFVDDEPAAAIADVRKAMLERHEIGEADCDQLLAEIGKRTKESASLFEISIGSTQDYKTILRQANDALMKATLHRQEHPTPPRAAPAAQNADADASTSLSSRARFDHAAAELFAAALEQNKPFSLLLIELDSPAKIRESFGDAAADAVLHYLGRLLKTVARAQDVAARYSDNELLLCLPETPRAAAAQVAEKVRAALAARPVKHEAHAIAVTASIGVAACESTTPFKQLPQLIKAAELALQTAQRGGGNCVKVFSLKPTAPSSSVAA